MRRLKGVFTEALRGEQMGREKDEPDHASLRVLRRGPKCALRFVYRDATCRTLLLGKIVTHIEVLLAAGEIPNFRN